MAKTTTKTKTKTPPPAAKGKAVATSSRANLALVDDIDAMMEEDAGKGVSTLASDNVVPLVYLLQALSPQCVRQNQQYITPGLGGEKGAVAGNIWFRGSKNLVDGENAGMLVQLCHFQVTWVEWGPERGDGLRGRHDKRPKEAVLETDPKNPKKKKWVMPDGNIVVETREHVILVHDEFDSPAPFVVPMSGSNHQAAKQWMTDINRKTTKSGKRAPLWAYLWRMKTVPRTDGENNWFSWAMEDENQKVTDVDAYKLAKQLNEDFDQGVKRADVAADDPDQSIEEEHDI